MKIHMTSIFVEDPVRAHEFYTETLGFRSLEFNEEAQLAVVVSAEDPKGTALLLEPRGDSFALEFQQKVYDMGLPIIVFSSEDVAAEVDRLKALGVVFREDLARPDWGLENIFEDGCGNFIMLSAPGQGGTS